MSSPFPHSTRTIHTERLVLRPWSPGDAPALFELARDPEVGPRAGWPAHRSLADSEQTIAGILSAPETYAITVAGGEATEAGSQVTTAGSEDSIEAGSTVIGCISLKDPHDNSHIREFLEAHQPGTGADGALSHGTHNGLGHGTRSDLNCDEPSALSRGARSDAAVNAHLKNTVELGYWIGRAYWGQGFVPEAARAVIKHAFTDLHAPAVWATHSGANAQSARVLEKLGFLTLSVCEDERRSHVCLLSGDQPAHGTTTADTRED